MLEFFAAVDPMTLPVWAVLLFSAAMYPLGFMLGAPCSACCDKCSQPCNKCMHSYVFNEDFGQPMCPEGQNINHIVISVAGHGSFQANNPGGEDFDAGDVVFNPAALPPLPDRPPKLPNDPNLCVDQNTWDGASLYTRGFYSTFGTDECGCQSGCSYQVGLQITFHLEDGYMDLASRLVSENVLENCNETNVTFSCDPWGLDDYAVGCGFGGSYTDPDGSLQEKIIQEAIEFANSLDISGAMVVNQCECGACCNQDFDGNISCEENVNVGACPKGETSGGVFEFKGPGVTCDVGCVTGACCDEQNLNDGGCKDVISDLGCDVAYQAGKYYPGARCIDNPCGVEGACCDGAGNCTQTTEGSCSGTWTEGVECDPNPCPPGGSCCDGAGNCTQTTQVNCSGTWTEGGQCDPNPCPQPPTGACCADGIGCLGEMTEADCSIILAENNLQGTWINGADCDPSPCPPPKGACCNGEDCTQTTQDECFGTWTEGADCDPNPCI